jgi:hypothetical protein
MKLSERDTSSTHRYIVTVNSILILSYNLSVGIPGGEVVYVFPTTVLYESNQQDALYRLIFIFQHVSGHVFAHHQEHFTVFTVSGMFTHVAAGWFPE